MYLVKYISHIHTFFSPSHNTTQHNFYLPKVMSRVLSVALLALLVCLMVPTQAEVIDLTPESLKKLANDPTKNLFVLFYAPWCGHCQQMKPQYEMLGKDFPSSGDVVIGRIDGSAHSDVAQEHNIQGFPTLKLFTKANKNIPYQGPRDAASFKSFLKDNTK